LRLAHFDAVAETVQRSVERAGAMFIVLTRDGHAYPMPARIRPNPPAAVAFVAHDPVWTALDGPGLQELFEDHRLVSLSRGEDQRHQLATAFGPHVDCGAEPASGAAQGFGVWVPFFAPAASAGACTAARSWFQTLARCQR
jgi:hypothetical protein